MMEEKATKPKRMGNHYIPPPARKQGNDTQDASRLKERPMKIFENRQEKLCNDSSLLFKDVDERSNDRSKRKRKSRRNNRKSNEENSSNLTDIVSDSKSSSTPVELNEKDNRRTELRNPTVSETLYVSEDTHEHIPLAEEDLDNTIYMLPAESIEELDPSLKTIISEVSPPLEVEVVSLRERSLTPIIEERIENCDKPRSKSTVVPLVSQPLVSRSTEIPPNLGQRISSIDDVDWDSLYDDCGDCLLPPPSANHTKEVPCQLAIDMQKLKISTKENSQEKYESSSSSIIEIYGFSEELKTNDILAVFSNFIQRGFNLKWVDNTHALGILPTPALAEEVLQCNLPIVKTRPISLGIPLSQERARTLVLPSSLRPKTCPALARRLVSGALGLRVNVTPEERAAERELLREAREQRKLISKQRDAAWEGNFNSSDGCERKES